MTQSLSFIVADSPPAMYRIEAVAIVVSRISMNVGITTAVATIQGLTAGRLTAFTLRAPRSFGASFEMIEGSSEGLRRIGGVPRLWNRRLSLPPKTLTPALSRWER